MSCVYLLDGHQFNSEIELDDFLLAKNYLRKELGDIVFQISTHQAVALDTLKKVTDEATRLEAEYDYARNHRILSDERDSYEFRAPYQGVNSFLSGFELDGRLLFPEFREDNYWKGRFDDWAEGNYTDDEKKAFSEVLGWDVNNMPKCYTSVQQEFLKDTIKTKWDHQALFGDAMHSVLELYFTRVQEGGTDKLDADGNYIYYKDILKTDPSFLDVMKSELSKLTYKNKKGDIVKFTDLMDDSQLTQALQQCTKIEQAVMDKFGSKGTPIFFPEFKITGKVVNPNEKGIDTLMGIIDLLVIDGEGFPHVVDYKTSVHPYEEFNDSKKLAYRYQIGTYGNLLAKAGLRITDTSFNIIPIQIADFQYLDDKYTYTGFQVSPSGVIKDISVEVNNQNTQEKLAQIVDYQYQLNLSTEDFLSNIQDTIGTWFPGYAQYKTYEYEDAKKICEDNNAFEPDETGKLVFKPKGSTSKPITIDASEPNAEDELVKKVLKWLQDRPKFRERFTSTIKERIKTAIAHGSPEGVEFADKGGQAWFARMVAPYCNKNWEVCTGEQFKPLEALGIITLFNAKNRQYNFIKISSQNLKRQYNFGSDKHTTLGGAFKSDLYFQSNPDSMMMQATYGNIELMETMLAINQLDTLIQRDQAYIGEILVADPMLGEGIQAASNKELLDTFNEIEQVSNVKIKVGNNFRNGKIKMGAKVQLARTKLSDIMTKDEEDPYPKYRDFKTCKNMLDTAVESDTSIDDKIEAIQKLMKQLETTDKEGALKNYTVNQDQLARDHIALYNMCSLALAELKGINFRQQLHDHAAWCETLMIHKFGLSGNMLDNPGNLKSDTLNLSTKLVTEAYQNVRADIQEPAAKMRELTEKLKKSKNFGWLQENTIGNQASLYENMYEFRNDDVYFKNPYDSNSLLNDAEREFLKYVLPIINGNRGYDPDRDPDKYFRIPLCEGDTSVIAAKDGLLAAFKDKMKGWIPKVAYERAKAKLEGVFSDEVQRTYNDSKKNVENLFTMVNGFDYGEGISREKILARGRYELNLETLFLKHTFAYQMKQRIDEVFPMIKASMINLTVQGFNQNVEGGFKNDIDYLEKYIKSKIKNESIIPEQYRAANEIANKLKTAASKLALGFSPVQFFYQSIQGIWNDISLIIRKPDGTDAFTLSNMLSAAKIVYKELCNPQAYTDKPTLIEQFNRLYGINDMDMNTYIDKIKTDQNGIFNFNNFLFKFASRPDYYNRMTIFVAKMINEGAYEAHSIKPNGTIEYDCAKDKRYKAFFDDDRSNPQEYEKAKMLYIANARQFEKENAMNPDGTKFKLDLSKKTKLPRAYTNLEAESMKSLSDTIYGYYSHEKKSMIQSTLWGSLFMQFKTFWSGKKNQYLAHGSVKLEGRWVPYTEKDENGNTIQYYYQKDKDGNILFNEPPVKEGDENASVEKVVRWEGNWKEGIVSTMNTFISNVYHNGWQDACQKLWYNEDSNLRNAYRSNVKQLGYDLMMFLVVGNILAMILGSAYDDEKKNSSETDMGDALKLSAMNIAIKSVRNSILDFNFINSIGDPAINWTPFAFEYFGNQASNVWDTVMGDQNVWTGIGRSNALFTQFKPVFHTLKVNSQE